MLSEQDHRRIAEAVARVETRTSGEIACVLSNEASHYREVPLAWAAVAALILPPVGLALGWQPLALADIFRGWTAAQTSLENHEILLTLSIYAMIQAVLFGFVALIVSIPSVRRALTPGFLKRHRVSQSARHHFAALGARLGPDSPYIVIYASRLDRKIEIVASERIHKATGDAPWRDATAALSAAMRQHRACDGFVNAIEICGAALAKHFPPTGEKRNALPDTLLET